MMAQVSDSHSLTQETETEFLAPGAWLRPGPGLANASISQVNQHTEDLSLSALLNKKFSNCRGNDGKRKSHSSKTE